MSFTLKKSYQLFKTSKFLIIIAQLIATFYLILWNIEFWQQVKPQVMDLFKNSIFTKNIETILHILSPSIISIAIYSLCLIILFILKKIILNVSIKQKNIVTYEKNGEIKPLFARRIATHYKWNNLLSLEDFFYYYNESNNQELVLKRHQYNKDFYDFLCKYDKSLSEDLPYSNPRTTVVRREELLDKEKAKIDPYILSNDNENDHH